MATLADTLALKPEQLRRRLDPALFQFESTAELEPLQGTIGQPRAIDAIEFGLEIDTAGYNLFIAGEPGSGRESTIRDYLRRVAQNRRVPPDWVYVHNFTEPDRPIPIQLPPGQGFALAKDMDEFLETARHEIPRAFESEDYANRRRRALSELSQRREELIQTLQAEAQSQGFRLEIAESGMITVPIVNGEPLSREQFEQLPEEQQQVIQERSEALQSQINTTLRRVRQLEREVEQRVRQLNREVAQFIVGPLLEDLREKYADHPDVLAYLKAVGENVPEHLEDFSTTEQEEATSPTARAQELQREERLALYQVNVLIDNHQTNGAPVVVERNPSYYALIGRVDYRSSFGSVVTDFRQIRPGALHRANGGYLVLQVVDLLREPASWQALKRALLGQEIQIENLGDRSTPTPTSRLQPQPIPLDVKVILLGPGSVYLHLYHSDEDFRELFKVKADFAPDMDWTEEHVQNYACFISRRVRDSDLRHFDPSGVARVIEYGSRLREDQGKLSARLLDVADLVAEASFWAEKAGHDLVRAEDVDTAIKKKEYRSNLAEERMHELYREGTILIDTDGSREGQVNGMAVMNVGDYVFGRPSRITARASLGQRGIESIEREIAVSGPIHAKGVLTLTGYLAGQYAQELPLAVSATVTFEQSYDGVEGDSASSAELFALLSAIAELPIKQGIAVTGSVNQHGEVQAVGGVTHKIEGFFAVCKAKGLTGEQGVIIPAANAGHLMLADEVIDAVRDNQFHVWAIQTVDQGIELLMDRPAGTRSPDGSFPEGTVHGIVEDRLRRYASLARSFASTGASVPIGLLPDDEDQ